ncbi:hypothetical protein PsorP6_009823 [Peronosclerospora sorghi]|uniref:Uncharacterized protein n=1 Tax=Peronosclerospora sorghi TaxID=230839 RepID=A0ACC0W0M3_9STRA|nr:hypothetical protein PsorP6_009823 [Peronosclerospora sorghi]
MRLATIELRRLPQRPEASRAQVEALVGCGTSPVDGAYSNMEPLGINADALQLLTLSPRLR